MHLPMPTLANTNNMFNSNCFLFAVVFHQTRSTGNLYLFDNVGLCAFFFSLFILIALFILNCYFRSRTSVTYIMYGLLVHRIFVYFVNKKKMFLVTMKTDVIREFISHIMLQYSAEDFMKRTNKL